LRTDAFRQDSRTPAVRDRFPREIAVQTQTEA
jgi:hypothetical protein